MQDGFRRETISHGEALTGAIRGEGAITVWVCARSPRLTPLDTICGPCRALALTHVEGEAHPGEVSGLIQLLPAGWVETETKGRFLVDQEAVQAIVAAFAESGRQLVIDYEHQSLTGQEAPAAGWITALEDRGPEGLWARVEWTERARQYLSHREYRYLSPVVLVRQSDKRAVALHSVALTNTPEIRRLLPLVAKTAIGHQPTVITHKEDRMRKDLIELLKLKAEATDEDILSALAARLTPHVPQEIAEALSLEAGASVSEAVATIHALKQSSAQQTAQSEQLTALQAELTALKQQLAAREADEAVAQALKDGKLTPAQAEWAKTYALRDPAGFALFAAKAPVVVPLGTVTTPLTQSLSAGLDDTQRSLNRMLGISDETFQKYAEAGA